VECYTLERDLISSRMSYTHALLPVNYHHSVAYVMDFAQAIFDAGVRFWFCICSPSTLCSERFWI